MTSFPDHDFKIDCGDDPKVRQWLHYNGCRIDDIPDRQVLLFIEAKNVQTCCNSRAFFERDPLPQIDPYDFIKPEPTVAERMAALIERFRDKIPEWAQWVAVDDGGLYAYQHAPKLVPGGFWPSSEKVERVQKQIESFLLANWRETLTELKPVNPVEDKPACNMAEIAARDERECTQKEAQVMARVAAAELVPSSKPLTIPSICLAEPTSHMRMLGGEFGGKHDSR